MNRCTRSVAFALVMLGYVAIGFGQTVLRQTGELRDLEGRPVPAGDYAIEFLLWNEPIGGEILWREHQQKVRVLNGQYSVELGRVTPLPLDPSGLWLETVVDGDLLSPRFQVSAKTADRTLDQLTVNRLIVPDSDLAFETVFDLSKFQDRVSFGSVGFGLSATHLFLDLSSNTFRAYTRFHVLGGGDAAASVRGSGRLIVGDNYGTNIAIDDNEIMARDSNSPANLGIGSSFPSAAG